MLKVTIHLTFTFLMMLSSLLAGCNGIQKSESPQRVSAAEDFMDLDFSEQVAASSFLGPGTEEFDRLQTTVYCLDGRDMSSLDEDEKKLLYVEQLTDGSIIPIQHISTYANMFRELNGRLPINGVELVPMLQSERGRSRFQELSRAEQYAQCHFAVNKLTGHFYADFDSNWKAGGVSLRAVASEGYMTDSGLSDIAPNVHSLPVRIIDPDTGVLAENVTEITFFGDDPEEVLYRDWAFGATEDAPEGGIGGDRK